MGKLPRDKMDIPDFDDEYLDPYDSQGTSSAHQVLRVHQAKATWPLFVKFLVLLHLAVLVYWIYRLVRGGTQKWGMSASRSFHNFTCVSDFMEPDMVDAKTLKSKKTAKSLIYGS